MWIPDVPDGFSIAFEDIGEGLGLNRNGASHEFWDIIALQEQTMIIGIGTRQFERFCANSFFVDVGEERTGIVAIVSATAEYHPFAVG